MIQPGSVVTLNSNRNGQSMTVTAINENGQLANVVYFDRNGNFQKAQLPVVALSIK